jgi:sulfoquinovosidase
MRWTELAAFTTVFRTHEGNRPKVNHQIYSDEETLRHFSASPRSTPHGSLTESNW